MNSSPIVAFVGKSKTGKTTLIEKIIRELRKRNYRVATIKNTLHKVDFDTPGKDTWRHIKAGSSATALSAADSLMIVKTNTGPDNFPEIMKYFNNDFDIVIVEGYKEKDMPKIEVHRKEKGGLLENLKNLLAIVTDEKVETDIPQMSFDDVEKITDIIEQQVIKMK